jgi:hypothetical protein
MRFRTVLFCLLSAMLVVAAFPDTSRAKGKKASVRSKGKQKRAKKKKKGGVSPKKAVADDPYRDEDSPAMDENAGDSKGPDLEGEGSQVKKGLLTENTGDGSLRRSNRMEFDERLVKGQAAKSGAVYLFKRVPRRLPGLVPMRRSYRRRIVEPVLGVRELKPLDYTTGAQLKKKQVPRKTVAKALENKADSEPLEGDDDSQTGKRKQGNPKLGGSK